MVALSGSRLSPCTASSPSQSPLGTGHASSPAPLDLCFSSLRTWDSAPLFLFVCLRPGPTKLRQCSNSAAEADLGSDTLPLPPECQDGQGLLHRPGIPWCQSHSPHVTCSLPGPASHQQDDWLRVATVSRLKAACPPSCWYIPTPPRNVAGGRGRKPAPYSHVYCFTELPTCSLK